MLGWRPSTIYHWQFMRIKTNKIKYWLAISGVNTVLHWFSNTTSFCIYYKYFSFKHLLKSKKISPILDNRWNFNFQGPAGSIVLKVLDSQMVNQRLSPELKRLETHAGCICMHAKNSERRIKKKLWHIHPIPEGWFLIFGLSLSGKCTHPITKISQNNVFVLFWISEIVM